MFRSQISLKIKFLKSQLGWNCCPKLQWGSTARTSVLYYMSKGRGCCSQENRQCLDTSWPLWNHHSSKKAAVHRWAPGRFVLHHSWWPISLPHRVFLHFTQEQKAQRQKLEENERCFYRCSLGPGDGSSWHTKTEQRDLMSPGEQRRNWEK